MEEDRPKAEARGDKRYGCDRKRNPMGGVEEERGVTKDMGASPCCPKQCRP